MKIFICYIDIENIHMYLYFVCVPMIAKLPHCEGDDNDENGL